MGHQEGNLGPGDVIKGLEEVTWGLVEVIWGLRERTLGVQGVHYWHVSYLKAKRSDSECMEKTVSGQSNFKLSCLLQYLSF